MAEMKQENPTPQVTEKAPKRNISKIVKNVVLSTIGVLMAADAAGATATELTDKKPFFHDPQEGIVQKAGYDLLHPLGWIGNIKTPPQEIIVSPTYDNNADKQGVQAGINATPVSEQELPALLKDAIKPVEPNKFPKPKILLPFKLTDGETLDIETYFTKSYNDINPELTGEPLASGKNFMISKKGTEIIVPVEGASVSVGTDIMQNKSYVTSYVIIFDGPDGTKYNLVITTPEDVRQISPSDLIKNAVADNNGAIADATVGTTIATTSSDNVKVNIRLFAYTANHKDGLPCNFDLVEKNENGKNTLSFVLQNTP